MYLIPDGNLGWLQDQIAGLAKRAKRLHMTPPSLEILSTEAVPTADGAVRILHRVEVHGERPVIAGWEFAATLAWPDEGDDRVILNAVPGLEFPIPAEYRTTDKHCDHCRTMRRRTDLYLLVNRCSGLWQQVGATCLQDFLGGLDPKGLAAYAEMLITAAQTAEAGEDEDLMSGGGSGGSYLHVPAVLTNAAQAIRLWGWLSRGAAREQYDAVATADRVADMLDPRRRKRMEIPPTPQECKTEAEAALAWIRDELDSPERTTPLDDYQWNLAAACRGDFTQRRFLGLVVSGIMAYRRELGFRLVHADDLKSQYVGRVGEKLTAEVLVVKITPCDTAYGVAFLVKMVDRGGNHLIWFASRLPCDPRLEWPFVGDLAAEDRVTLKGTVKEHQEYRGVRQTVLTRCKVLNWGELRPEVVAAVEKHNRESAEAAARRVAAYAAVS